jgi:membrane protease YdiL (CAAX protease family)
MSNIEDNLGGDITAAVGFPVPESRLESTSQATYLDAARWGKASLWRYLAGFLSIIFIWLGFGSLATGAALAFFALVEQLNANQIAEAITNPAILGPTPYFVVLNVSFILFFAGIWLVVIGIHRRSLRSVITAKPSIDWKRIGFGFVIWFLLGVVGSVIEFLMWPETFSVNFEPLTFLVFGFIAIILTPLQTTSEELFFRGYLVQAGSLLSRNAIFLSLLSGVLFALPHIGNPELAANFYVVLFSYFVLGAFLAWISIKDGTIELAIGVHAANNLFAGLVVTFPLSALQTPAIFYTTHFDPLFNLVVTILLCAVFYVIVFVRRRKPAATII